MVQATGRMIKYLLFVFNFIFVVSGIALIVVGAIVQSSGKEFTIFLDSKFVTAPTILIVVGIIIFFIAFLGCCGAVKENRCMILTFGVLIFLIFVIELAGGIAAYVYRHQLEDVIKKNMKETLKQDKQDFNNIWDEVQLKYKCCGIKSYEDYVDAKREIPQSCCNGIVNDTCTAVEAKDKPGCFDKLETLLKPLIGMVGGAAIGVGVIEILGIVFACCLASAIKKEYEGV